MTGSHYDVLGVDPTAGAAAVRQAYLTLARLHHPDRAGGDAATMRAVNEAWTVLGDPARRARYDLDLGFGRRPSSPAEERAPVRSDADDLAADLADDTPLGGQVVLPGWLSLVPVAVFLASLALLGAGLTFGSAPAIAGSVICFAVSCAMFLAAPFVAMLVSRHRSG